jgi:5-methylcytosine-specific restriction protein A
MFTVGETYRRRDLHEKYGGQMQGGISTPAGQDFIMLFTSTTGEQYGYKDGWSGSNLFLYTGEGQQGDMTFARGNLAIRDHLTNKKVLHLFEYTKTGFVQYVGEMMYRGFQYRRGPDINGNQRQLIVFELTPVKR